MFQRISNLIRGFFGLFISGLEKKNPEALLEVEKENLREQISKYNKGLAAHAALCERLMAQVRRLEKEETELRAKAAANLKAGNRRLAGEYAVRLQSTRRELEDNTKQLEDAETTYKELVEARDVSVRAAREKIESLRQGISDMKIKQATAELAEMASGMVSEIGGAGDTLNRLEEMVAEEREKAAGRARVARDAIDTTELKAQAAEQEALGELALADLAAELGMNLDGSETASPATESAPTEDAGRSMGPSPKKEDAESA